MDDLTERLRDHARRLDELGESKVMGHILPDTCKRISEDIGKAADKLDSVPVTDTTECKQVEWRKIDNIDIGEPTPLTVMRDMLRGRSD